jgi:hypothetical protein
MENVIRVLIAGLLLFFLGMLVMTLVSPFIS